MMRVFTLAEIAQCLESPLDAGVGARLVSGVSTDTRAIEAGDLFVALRGEHFDAHAFLETAKERGAVGAVVNRDALLPQIDGLPLLVVDDTRQALGRISALNRAAFKGSVIAVTGSCGKTTVKEMMAAILAEMGPVLATKGNLNNDVGVPLTLFALSEQHRSAVIELGASAVGEIAYTAALARPCVAVLTNAGEAHLEGFGGYAGVVRAKGEIVSALAADGIAVLNADDPAFDVWRTLAGQRNVMACSLEGRPAAYQLADIEPLEDGWQFTARGPEGWACTIQLPMPGRHNLLNALMAIAATRAVGATDEAVVAGLHKLAPVPGRLQRHAVSDEVLLIDDSYNANPTSMRAAIDLLAARNGLRCLVVGDMAELGDDEVVLHEQVGAYAASAGIDRLFACGRFAGAYARGFGEQAQVFDDQANLVSALLALQVGSGALTLLVKGSRSAGMDRVVKQLLMKGTA